MTKKRVLPLLLALALLLCAAGTVSCGQKDEPPTKDRVLHFTDALGREVALPLSPVRVAALLGSFADVWVLSGGTLCACAEDAWEDFGLDPSGAVNLGGAHSPSLELLVSAAPELVLASASTASHVEMRAALESMNITVAYFDVDHFEDYLQMLKICTELTGRADLYAQNGTAIKAQIDAIKADLAARALPESERRILLLRAASGFVKAKGSTGTILGEMLADLGCINIADSDKSLLDNLSVEAVIREAPRHVFVVTMGSNTQAAVQSLENLLKENPAWGTIDAIANDRLHIMDKKLFNLKPNARWAESYRVLYETLTDQ